MKRTTMMLLFAVAATFGIAATARAEVIVFTNRAAFTSNLTSSTTATFEGIVPAGQTLAQFTTSAGLAVSGVTFTSQENFLQVVTPAAGYDYGSGASLVSPQGQVMRATLPPNVTAVGSDIMLSPFFPPGGPYRVTLSTADFFYISAPAAPGRGFIGFTSTIPITSVEFRLTSTNFDQAVIDNFTFGQTAPVPEPASLILFGTGVAGVIGAARKRRKAGTGQVS